MPSAKSSTCASSFSDTLSMGVTGGLERRLAVTGLFCIASIFDATRVCPRLPPTNVGTLSFPGCQTFQNPTRLTIGSRKTGAGMDKVCGEGVILSS